MDSKKSVITTVIVLTAKHHSDIPMIEDKHPNRMWDCSYPQIMNTVEHSFFWV
jgi:hypothetical protein